MKVLIYTHEYPPFAGGAGVYSQNLARGLVALGVDVHVLTEFRGEQVDAQSVSEQRAPKMHYLRNHQHKGKCAVLCIIKLWLKEKCDAVFVTEFQSHLNLASCIGFPIPYVNVLHGTELLTCFRDNKVMQGVTQHKMLKHLKRSTVLLTGSHATHELAIGLLDPDCPVIDVVHYGIDPNMFGNVGYEQIERIKNRLADVDRLLLCVGRLYIDKGHDILLKAFTKVHALLPVTKLAIVGDGQLREELFQLREELLLGDSVIFTGKVSDEERAAWYKACDLFVMPSRCDQRWEGMGLVYLEAHLFGKPCIGGREGGVPEAVEHEKTGLIVDPRDPDAVANAILRLLHDPDYAVQLGQAGRRRVHDYFNHIRMAKETLDIVETHLKNEGWMQKLLRTLCFLPWGFVYIRNRVSSLLLRYRV